ncbi:hypothetical protein C8R48DRAFT_778312 [Suillus tomentosus]|nr:hypothetical protein C8R48DRAFT_778312 [Suillus tomentosus]
MTGTSPDSTQPDNVLEGMDILLKRALGMGRKTVARAIKARGTPLSVAHGFFALREMHAPDSAYKESS